MKSTEHPKPWVDRTSKKRLLDLVFPDGQDKPADPFAAILLGRTYERLLTYYFERQRVYTAKDRPTWRAAGHAWVSKDPGGRRIPQDFLLEWPLEPGTGPTGHKLVCFEAKCWPAYRGLGMITKNNIGTFLAENRRFLDYIELGVECWTIRGPESADRTRKQPPHEPGRKPDAFGFLVFDYAKNEEAAILHTLQGANPHLQHIASIADMLSMVLYNEDIKEVGLLDDLKRQRETADRFFGLFT